MSKDLSISMLMDFYGQLLTEKQRITLDLYYNQDAIYDVIAKRVYFKVTNFVIEHNKTAL